MPTPTTPGHRPSNVVDVSASRRGARLLRAFRSTELRDAVQAAIADGWRWERTRGGHVRLYAPDGAGMVTLSPNAGPSRGDLNAIAELARHGVSVGGKRPPM